MEYKLCLLYGFDQARIDEMLHLLELGERDIATADHLQSRVIEPGLSEIIKEFYQYLQMHREYREYFDAGEQLKRMMTTQESYLKSLGVNFRSPDYFESRLKIGTTHSQIGLPPRLYECAYTRLKQLIAEKLPEGLAKEERRALRNFLDRIIALDMSLALESYYQMRIDSMQASITALEDIQQKLRKQSAVDMLTGAASRNTVLGYIKECLGDLQSVGDPFSLVKCHIEDLSEVNAKYGYMVGDLVLKKAVEKILSYIRKSDMLGRYGGAEFLLVLRSVDAEQTNKVIDKLCSSFTATAIHIKDKQFDLKLKTSIVPANKNDDLPLLLSRLEQRLK